MLALIQVKEIFEVALKAPVATLLIVFGILFLALCIVGNNKFVKPGKQGRMLAGIIGGLMVLIGVGIHLRSIPTANPALKFAESRPSSGGALPKDSDYYRVGPALDTTTPQSAQMGLTVWRLRKPLASDDGRLLFQDEDSSWMPERVEGNSDFHIGDRVFLTIESPQAGYLYVIDREQYSDGSNSKPYLIYPNSKSHDNAVRPGLLIRIPGRDETPSCFLLKPSQSASANQVGELLSIIVTPNPIAGLSLTAAPLPLSADQIQTLEGAADQAERYEMKNGSGKTWTSSEKESSGGNSRLLTQEDPMPQSIYKLSPRPGAPLMIRVVLKYA
jgi:hypothetical protein